MTILRALISKLIGMLRGGQDAALDEEIAEHLAALENEHRERGLSQSEARAAALRDFGSVARMKEAHREQQGAHLLDGVRQDARYALRMMRRAPGFTLAVVLTLALGIGANAAIFSFLDVTLWESVPVDDPRHLFALSWTADRNPQRNGAMETETCIPPGKAQPVAHGCTFPPPLVDAFTVSDAFRSVAAFIGPIDVALAAPDVAQTANTYLVSGNFFDTIGVRAALGRTIEKSDDVDGAEPVAVVSYELWQTALRGDPAAVGRTLRIGTGIFTIVGVAEPRFTRLSPGFLQDVWISRSSLRQLGLTWLPPDIEGLWGFEVLARLKPEVTPTEAAAQATLVFNRWAADRPKPIFTGEAHPAVHVTTVQQALTGVRDGLTGPGLLMMGCVGLLLLIVSANVAGLVLARNASRRQEIAVRRALGAGRGRIARQMIVESLVLSAVGGIAGTLIALWGAHVLVAFLETGRIGDTSLNPGLDVRLMLFLLAATVCTGLLFGVAPAVLSAREELMPSMKAIGRGSGRRFTVGRWLVVTQVALSVLLLFLGSLLVRSLMNLQRVETGFNANNLIVFGVDPNVAGYSPERMLAFFRDVKANVEAVGGVTSVSYGSNRLLSGSVSTTNLNRLDGPGSVEVEPLQVGPGFFTTLGIPILAGRGFNLDDFATGTRPIVVNQTFVREFLGRSSSPGDLAPDAYPTIGGRRIVGVVPDIKVSTLRAKVRPAMYSPLRRNIFETNFFIRTSSPLGAIVPEIQRAVARADANIPLQHLQTQREAIARLLFIERLYARVSLLFSIAAIALVAIGLYGLLAYSVAQRRREIGIRLALGEQPARLQRRVVWQSLLFSAGGLAIGVPIAIVVGHWLASITFDVRPYDPVSVAVVLLLIPIVSIAAAWLPARRAASVDPMSALRQD